MTTRSEREKAQKLNEQHQVILSKMLREDDNKYCADCEAKGPRWASWNLGVFMCIRCAGIHRNLGVHISRVKSVNLDQWTPEQIQSMVDMGNNRAKQMYEAHLPDNFRRPQTDQAVEVFIRDKYERKKYFNKDAVITPPKEREKKKEEKKREKDSEKVDKTSNTKKRDDLQCDPRASPKRITEPAVDLLGLDAPASGTVSGVSGSASSSAQPISEEDIFGPMVSNPLPSSSSAKLAQASTSPVAAQTDTTISSTTSPSSSTNTKNEEKKPLSKDSILSLYASSSVGAQPQSQQHTAQAQGMYMGQPQMQFPPQGFPAGMGAVAPPAAMMAAGGMMPGMAMPNGGYVGMVQQGMVPAGAGQNMYNMQQQQGQWNVTQMTQQMSGVSLAGGAAAGVQAPGAFGQAGAPMADWSAGQTSSGQTLSNQLWK